MELCSNGHYEVCFDVSNCPACELEEAIAELEEKISDLENELEEDKP